MVSEFKPRKHMYDLATDYCVLCGQPAELIKEQLTSCITSTNNVHPVSHIIARVINKDSYGIRTPTTNHDTSTK
jgi:hypothetical protein